MAWPACSVDVLSPRCTMLFRLFCISPISCQTFEEEPERVYVVISIFTSSRRMLKSRSRKRSTLRCPSVNSVTSAAAGAECTKPFTTAQVWPSSIQALSQPLQKLEKPQVLTLRRAFGPRQKLLRQFQQQED